MWKPKTKANTAVPETAPETAWTMPPELERGTPRAVELNTAGWAVAVSAVALGAAALTLLGVFSYSRASAQRQREAILREGVSAEAEILRTGITSDDEHKRFAVYRYEIGGNSYSGRVTLRHSDHRPARPGDPLPVRYLAAEPGKSWVEGYEPEGPPVVVMVVVPLSFAGTSLLLGWSMRRQRSLLEEGRAARAQVVEVKWIRIREKNGKRFRVEYEFTTLSGALKRVKLDAKRKPALNTVVTLVYDRDNPRRASVYPFPLVRVARSS